MKGFSFVSKVVKVLSVALVLTAILTFSVTGVVLADNGNGAGDGTGTYSDCPDDCGDCGDCGDCDDCNYYKWGGSSH